MEEPPAKRIKLCLEPLPEARIEQFAEDGHETSEVYVSRSSLSDMEGKRALLRSS